MNDKYRSVDGFLKLLITFLRNSTFDIKLIKWVQQLLDIIYVTFLYCTRSQTGCTVVIGRALRKSIKEEL